MSRFLVYFGGIWLLVGAPLAIGGAYLFTLEREFDRHARTATGTVLARNVERSRGGSRSTTTTYSAQYRAATPEGQVLEGSTDVSRERWLALVEGGPVEIAYVAGNPTAHRVAGTSRRLLATILTSAGGAAAAGGGAILLLGVRGARRRRRLRETGLTTDAVVTRVQATAVTINGEPQARVHYEFLDDRGEQHTGRSGYLPAQRATGWKTGDRIRIRYDRDQPGHSMLDDMTSGAPHGHP